MFAQLLAYDDWAALPRITVPALLIWGNRDAVVSREMQDALVARVPNAALTVYAGAGHTPRWEDPQRFADDLAAFVRRTA
jgi:pimeloyl-ACP methyl ester carboxylesterase